MLRPLNAYAGGVERAGDLRSDASECDLAARVLMSVRAREGLVWGAAVEPGEGRGWGTSAPGEDEVESGFKRSLTGEESGDGVRGAVEPAKATREAEGGAYELLRRRLGGVEALSPPRDKAYPGDVGVIGDADGWPGGRIMSVAPESEDFACSSGGATGRGRL